jgi:hypothetical protein
MSRRSDGPTLLVHAAAPASWVRSFRYEASLRRYVPQAGPAAAPGGALSELAVETGPNGAAARIWIAWVSGGGLRAASTTPDLGGFGAGISLGSSAEVLPRWIRSGASLGVLWSDGASVRFRSHADGDAADAWSPVETAWSGAVESLAAASDDSGAVVAAAGLPGGTGRLLRRDAGGAWTESPIAGDLRDPALLADPARGRIHLFHAAVTRGAHRVLRHREADLADLAFGDPGLVAGWPGVEPARILTPASPPETGPDLVAVALGDDGRGYFGRVQLPAGADREAPFTLQHVPPPGTVNVAAGATISFRIEDSGLGVDRGTLKLLVDGSPVALRIRGVPGNLLVEADLPAGTDPEVRIRIVASDLASPANVMTPFEYGLEVGPAADPRFRRGDANDDGGVDVSDAIRFILRLFAGGPALTCSDAGDANDDGTVDLSDPIAILEHLFRGGAPPPPPGPTCGIDPIPDELDCAAQPGCAAR